MENRTKENVQTYGYTVMMIPADNYLPAFAYTVGLFETYQHPEIVAVGLPHTTLKVLIDNVCNQIKEGKRFESNNSYSNVISKHDVCFVEVDQTFYPEYLGQATDYYGSKNFPCIQLVWCDSQGNFPWDENFDVSLELKQPLFDRDTDFLFYEKKNLGVFITKDILEGKPILYVYHDEDGDWQFHSCEEPDEDRVALVALKQIVQLDPSLNQLYYLGYGQSASRKSIHDDWLIQ